MKFDGKYTILSDSTNKWFKEDDEDEIHNHNKDIIHETFTQPSEIINIKDILMRIYSTCLYILFCVAILLIVNNLLRKLKK